MKPLIRFSILSAIFTLTGCEKLTTKMVSDDYQLTSTPSGETFIFHPKTGKISRVTKDGIESLSEATTELQVGKYYRLADATGEKPFVKYLGGGKFEEAKYAIIGR